MDISNNFWYFNKNNQEDLVDFMYDLHDAFPEHVSEVKRLYDIVNMMRATYITVVFEMNYVDKQYRDTYYAYFSQKFRTYERNCLRISFFDSDNMVKIGEDKFEPAPIKIQHFANLKFEIAERLIGTIVLRPLISGNLGSILINPSKLKVTGYIRTGMYHVMIFGRKIGIRAFPFISQDSEAMTCAETVIYNLLRYYGERYSEYRAWTPSEILEHIERETSERALPSKGIASVRIAKLLSDAHMYPRIYRYKKNNDFEQIVYSYIESGIPFIICVPEHAVSCIGHGIGEKPNSEELRSLSSPCERTHSFNLSTVKLNKRIIVMNDNKVPYDCVTLDSLVEEYAKKVLPEYDEKNLEKIKEDHLHVIVPVYKRIFMDAAQANGIIQSWFLENADFIKNIREAYFDYSWGRNRENPFVWRVYLTASRSYRYFKTQTITNEILRTHYMQCELPRFIWVCEIGTMQLQEEKLSRVEIVLDATSSKYSENIGILSIGYKNHFIYVDESEICCIEEDFDEEEEENEVLISDCAPEEIAENKDIEFNSENEILNLETEIKEEYLHSLFQILYTHKCEYFD